MVEKVCFDITRLRTSHLCRAFHVTSRQHNARTANRRSILSQNITGVNAAAVARQPSQQSNKFDDLHDVIEPLNDDSQFE